jgi:hypothetical protein
VIVRFYSLMSLYDYCTILWNSCQYSVGKGHESYQVQGQRELRILNRILYVLLPFGTKAHVENILY